MKDITITTEQLTRLAPLLFAIAPLSPPPTAKGKYALIRAMEKVEKEFTSLIKADLELTQRCAVKDSFKDIGNGRASFDIKPELREEYAEQHNALFEETITLTGLRPITRAELGECPITIQQDRVLVECGLLEPIPTEE